MSLTDTLLDHNKRYAAKFVPPAQHPHGAEIAVVACMDARLDVYAVLGLRSGQAHVIRNAGGAVTDDAIRSLLISQRLLGSREIMLIHHTDCGMLTFRDDEVKAQVAADCGIRPPFSLESFTDLDEDVRQSIARLTASPFLLYRDEIRGFVYDVDTGRLREVS